MSDNRTLRAIYAQNEILWQGEMQIYRMLQRIERKLDRAIIDAGEAEELKRKLKAPTDQLRQVVADNPLPKRE